jgi:hypothetical protein
MGAVAAGVVAGALDGSTQAIVDRKVVALHPAAGAVFPWQETQRDRRSGAISGS